ncbi:alpha/beta hydrolase [Roseateles sp.]|uniref:alpha/beta hydrolase n=1 Tax=Roseateles sp. TaxID=1971397 RepID=UPI00286BB58F|nr:alpha/beta fold hydrolase [Roseateles sp.]
MSATSGLGGPLRVGVMLAALLAVVLVALLAVGLLWVYKRQEQLLFQPEVLPASHRFEFGADVVELRIPVDGAVLSALQLRVPNPKGLVFYLHGNAGSLQSWFVNADFYRRAGYELVMLDYRGYGKSSGRIESEAQMRADVRAAWGAVAPRYAGLRCVIVGRSLGTSLAAGLAIEVKPEYVVLISPYTRMADLMRQHFPLLPTALLRYPLDTAALLPAWRGPLLLIHGEQDTLIPPQHSERLLALRPQGRLAVIRGAGHKDLQGFEQYLQVLREVLP